MRLSTVLIAIIIYSYLCIIILLIDQFIVQYIHLKQRYTVAHVLISNR